MLTLYLLYGLACFPLLTASREVVELSDTEQSLRNQSILGLTPLPQLTSCMTRSGLLYISSLSLSFLTCEIGMVIPILKGCGTVLYAVFLAQCLPHSKCHCLYYCMVPPFPRYQVIQIISSGSSFLTVLWVGFNTAVILILNAY